jgi:DHA2 family multidrug resistance protein
VTAARQAYVSIWGLIERQASMLSFVDTFVAMGVVFLLVLPLLLVMKRPRHSRGGAAMH